MSVPAAAVAGPVLVIARSANRWTVVIAVAVLLAALVSSAGLLAVTVAEFVSTVPLAVFGGTRAPILKLTLASLASVPTVHATTWRDVSPDVCSSDLNVVPAGSVSVTVPPLDVEGPLLVTVTV